MYHLICYPRLDFSHCPYNVLYIYFVILRYKQLHLVVSSHGILVSFNLEIPPAVLFPEILLLLKLCLKVTGICVDHLLNSADCGSDGA